MPTVIIRPDASTSSTGFDQSGANLVSRINDNDTGTFVVNTGSTSEFVVEFNNDNAYSGATINNVVVSITGNTINSKVPELGVEVVLRDGSSGLQSSTLTFTPTESTESTAAYSTSLTPSIVDAFVVAVTPSALGIFIKEVFITVDYTAAASGGGTITLSSGKITLTSGKITL